MENSWPDQDVQLVRNGEQAETFFGERFTFKTVKDETVNLYPVESGG